MKNKYFYPNSVVFKLIYLIFLIILLIPYYRISEMPLPGIDNSWRIALEIAYQKGLIFGKDIIYTYGPLGRLTQRIAIETSHFELFLYDIFCYANTAYILYFFLPKDTKIIHYLIHFAFFVVISSIFGEWISFLLFFVSIIAGFRFLKNHNHWELSLALLMGIINFFIKANYGIVAVLFVFVLLIYAFFTDRLSWTYMLAYMSGAILLVFILGYFLKTDILAYLNACLQIIKGYNEAQSVFPYFRAKAVLSSYFIFISFTLLSSIYLIKQVKNKLLLEKETGDTLFLLGSIAVSLFILLKYAFVRADDAHLISFVKNASIPLIFLTFQTKERVLRYGVWLLVVANILSYFLFYQSIYGQYNISIISNLKAKKEILPQYFKEILVKPQHKPKATYPKEALQIIGKASVDLIPNEASEVYFNGLNYNPRPIMQSYQAYNQYLDKINQEKYLSSNAPSFVIYGIESIDGKYALGDETLTFLALMKKYTPVFQWENRLLLKNKNQEKKIQWVSKRLKKIKLGQVYEIVPPSIENKIFCVATIKVKYNKFGKWLNFFFQPPHLSMKFMLENGQSKEFTTMPTLLEKGLIINSFTDNVADISQLIETGQVKNKAIRSIVWEEKKLLNEGFEQIIEIEENWYRIK